MRKFFQAALLLAGLSAMIASAECITDNGSYVDDYNFRILWFKNTCDRNVTVNTCVKSYPNGAPDAVFNPLSGTAYTNNTLYLNAGKNSDFDSYQWNEDAAVSCPF